MTINTLIPAIVIKAVDAVVEEIEKNGQGQTNVEQEDSTKETDDSKAEVSSSRRGRPSKTAIVQGE
jgi:hypothetical protein